MGWIHGSLKAEPTTSEISKTRPFYLHSSLLSKALLVFSTRYALRITSIARCLYKHILVSTLTIHLKTIPLVPRTKQRAVVGFSILLVAICTNQYSRTTNFILSVRKNFRSKTSYKAHFDNSVYLRHNSLLPSVRVVFHTETLYRSKAHYAWTTVPLCLFPICLFCCSHRYCVPDHSL